MPPNPLEKPGWVLDTHDEFDEEALDEALWIPSYFESRTTKERAAANYSLSHGNLVLYIDQDSRGYYNDNPGSLKVSSIQTGDKNRLHKDNHARDIEERLKYAPKYGYFEIRAKLAGGPGYQCAFWTVGIKDEPTHAAEIDIGEHFGNAPRELKFNLYTWGDKTLKFQKIKFDVDFAPENEFHIYALEWDEKAISMYVDGKLTRTISQSPAYPCVFLLSLYENSSSNNRLFPLPQKYRKEFVIDYFRAYKKEGQPLTPKKKGKNRH